MDYKVGQIVGVINQGKVEDHEKMEKRVETHIIDEIKGDTIKTHMVDDETFVRVFQNNPEYGYIENKTFFRSAGLFPSREAAETLFKKNQLENWFRIEFSKVPYTKFSTEKLKQAKELLENSIK